MHQDDVHYQDSIRQGFPNQQRSINLSEVDDEKATKEIGVSYEDLRRRHRAGLQTQRQPILKPKEANIFKS